MAHSRAKIEPIFFVGVLFNLLIECAPLGFFLVMLSFEEILVRELSAGEHLPLPVFSSVKD